MARGHCEHLFVVEHGLELELWLVQRVGRDQHVDLVAEERADAADQTRTS
jgi:hypothetical protein